MPRCKRCGKTLKDQESIDRGYGPECYEKRAKGFKYQLEIDFNPLARRGLSMLEQYELVKRTLDKKI